LTRLTPDTTPQVDLEDDQLYRAVLVRFSIAKSKNPAYPDDRLEVELEGKQGLKMRDWIGLKLGERSDGSVSKLRQLLNALAEKPKDAEVWFDPSSFEWGYDMREGSAAYATLTPGMVLNFKGENQKKGDKTYYRITGYRAASNNKRKAKAEPVEPPVDVDPEEIPF
jgi:hypothetical protein